MPDVQDTVAFLSQPAAYPDAPRAVTAIETHMSWVFLTDTFAYKLKKPVRHEELDFTTPERRRHCCEDEVRLNRRLAPTVYLGVVPVTLDTEIGLALGGDRHPIDWLVKMRRLPAAAMLDAVNRHGRVAEEEAPIRAAGRHLARFYLHADRRPIAGAAHRARLARGTRRDRRELCHSRFDLPRDRVNLLVDAQLAFLDRGAGLFDDRTDGGRIVDGHGDLRPEHICLHPSPAIIDCLEFSKGLRVLDPADELAFLGLECARLGNPQPGRWFLEAYQAVTGDRPPAALLGFYRVYRALRRARLAIWHLDDPAVRDPARFAALARWYLNTVEPVSASRTATERQSQARPADVLKA